MVDAPNFRNVDCCYTCRFIKSIFDDRGFYDGEICQKYKFKVYGYEEVICDSWKKGEEKKW